MKRAILYARVSSDLQQKERTIESQIAELKKQIAKTGDKLVKEYVDDGYSGAKLDRPAMNEVRMDLKKGTFETIYILNTDRIARDVTYQNIIVGEMLHYKKQIIINGKDYIHNPENKFTLTVLGAVSELERAKLIERIMRGRQYRLNQGLLLGHGHHTYGYTYMRKTATSFPSYAVNEKEAKIVRYIFETYVKDEIGVRPIARRLEKMGAPVKGRNRLQQTNIKGILHNEMYTGVRYFNTMTNRETKSTQMPRDRSEWIGVKIPAIISKKLFDKAQVKLNHNRETFRNAHRSRLLSNLVWCGACGTRCYVYGRHYEFWRQTPERGYRRFVYRCGSKNPSNHNIEINGQVIESRVLTMVQETMLDPKKLYASIDFLKKKKRANHVTNDRQLKEVDERLHGIVLQKKRIVDLYATEELDREEYVRRIHEYDTETDALTARRSELLKFVPIFQETGLIKQGIAEYCKTTKQRLEYCTGFTAKRKFFLDFVTKVVYRKSNKTVAKVKLYGSVPVKIPQSTEPIPVPFTIEHKIETIEMLTQFPKESLSDDAYYGASVANLSQIIRV